MSEIVQEQASYVTSEQTAKGYRTFVKCVQKKDESDLAFISRAVDMQVQYETQLKSKGYVLAPIEGGKKTEPPSLTVAPGTTP